MPYKDKEDKNAHLKRWRANCTPEQKDKAKTTANTRSTTLRRYLDDIKMSRGCVDCGYNKHPSALDFDHVSGEKSLLVSSSKSQAQADAEIAKCEVRCANCHRIVTWERRWGKPDVFEKKYEAVGGLHES